MQRVLTLVKYDYLQRVRSYRFLIILCASLVFAAALIPEPGSTYSTVSVGDYLGYYNSAWIAYVTAIMTSVFISLFGYYIINNSIRIDEDTKVGQLVAATDITNFYYLLTRFLGNYLVLLTIVICAFLVGIILFFVHNTGFPFEISQFLLAYLLIPIPTVFFISALAIVLEVLFGKKSVLQNTIFFILFTMMLTQSWVEIDGDPFGVRMPTAEMERQVNAIDASSEEHSLNIGFVIRQRSLDKRFDFSGISITSKYLLFRIFWPLLGIFMIYLVSRFFHRFELNRGAISSRRSAPQQHVLDTSDFREMDLSLMPQLEKSLSIWPVLKIEFLMMIRKGKKWLWILNLVGMVLLVVTPIDIAHKMVLPILWFLQVHRWADLVSKEKAHQMHYFVYSSYRPVQRLLSAQFLAGVSLAVLLALPLMARYLLEGQWLPIVTIVLGALFIIGLSALVGIASGGKRLFEILFFFIAYLNVNGLPYTDYFGGLNQSLGYLILLGGVAISFVIVSFLLRSFELRRI